MTCEAVISLLSLKMAIITQDIAFPPKESQLNLIKNIFISIFCQLTGVLAAKDPVFNLDLSCIVQSKILSVV